MNAAADNSVCGPSNFTPVNSKAGILGDNTEPLFKVMSWYDNEWGFSNRMLDTTVALMTAK